MGLLSRKDKSARDEVSETAKPFAEVLNRFPLDEKLRANGFCVYSRIGREATWLDSSTGRILTQTQALKEIEARQNA